MQWSMSGHMDEIVVWVLSVLLEYAMTLKINIYQRDKQYLIVTLTLEKSILIVESTPGS